MIKNYIINNETSAFLSYFHDGYECTQVLEGKESFFVSQSPDQIVRESFLHTGSDLEGAKKSAGFILKMKYKLPVCLSAQKNIMLIQCNSTKEEGSVWLINSHILDIHSYETNQTTVYTNGGHILTVAIKTDRLQNKRNQATFLHTTLFENKKMNRKMTFLYEKEKGIKLIKKEGHLNFHTY